MADTEKSAVAFADVSQSRKASIASLVTPDVKVAQVIDIVSTDEENRKVLRRIDTYLLPLMGFCYILQFMDKSSLSYSSVLGLRSDTHLHGSEYSWCSSIFYFGYLIWSWPTSYLFVRLPIGKYLSVSVLIWAGILMCHAACKNFAGLMAVRFLLGMAEASIAPGFSHITGMFYLRKEQPLRHGVWFAGNAVANLVGGLVAFGIGNIKTSSLPSWKLLFLILGAITAAYAVVLFFILPDSPNKAVFLNSHERDIALNRTLENKTGIMDEGSFKMGQMWEALRDPQAWLLVLYTIFVNIPNGGVTAFNSLIIAGFGFSNLKSLLVQMSIGASQLVFLGITASLATYLRNSRIILMAINVSVSLVGMVMVYALDSHNRAGRLAGLCLGAVFAVNIPLSLSLIASNVAGFTKKTTVAAMLFIAYSVGNIVGPQFFFAREAPRYETGLRSTLAGLVLGIIFLVGLYLYYLKENRRRDKSYPQESHTEIEIVSEEVSNQTDRKMTSFRYVL